MTEAVDPTDAGLVAIGWATVDLDRAVDELRDGSGPLGALVTALGISPPAARVTDAARDAWLGARCRRVAAGGGGPDLVLLEPDTEGRLAASLARFGEGPVVRWVRGGTGVPAAGGAWRSGPFGPERLRPGASAWGPHVLELPGGEGSH